MLRKLSVLILVGATGAGVFWWLTNPGEAVPQREFARLEQAGDAKRGEIVFNAGGCASCHASPGQADRLKLGGGLALPSPFGTFYVPNISSDPREGIGGWSAGDLANAMVAGVSPKGEHYYPAFPYTTYAHANIMDISDLSAYLRTLAPVAGKARDHDLPFPFNVRRTVGIWKLLFLNASPIQPKATQSARWNRGHYLVEALGHCAECHSPRNILGGIDASYRLSGGPNPEGRGWVPNITQAHEGLAKWSVEEIAEVLKTGFTPDFDSVGGSMAAVVRNTSMLPEADRGAMAEYVKSLPPTNGMQRLSKPAK